MIWSVLGSRFKPWAQQPSDSVDREWSESSSKQGGTVPTSPTAPQEMYRDSEDFKILTRVASPASAFGVVLRPLIMRRHAGQVMKGALLGFLNKTGVTLPSGVSSAASGPRRQNSHHREST